MPEWLVTYFGYISAFFVTLFMLGLTAGLLYVVFTAVKDWNAERKERKKLKL